MTKNAAVSEEVGNVVHLQPEGEVRFAGTDDGHDGIKIVTDDWRQIHVPSRITRGADLISLNDADDNVYEGPDGTLYAVSPTLPYFDTTFSDYALSDINLVLVHHALAKAGLGGQRVNLVTGLPVGDYYVANRPNVDFISRKVAHLRENTVRNKNESVALATIVKHNVVSEAIAAFFDLLLDREGNQRDDVAEMVAAGGIAIIDIGGKTTDTAVVMNGGRDVDGKRSGTDPIGGLSLNKAVENQLKAEFSVSALNPAQVDRAVREGVLRLYGKDHDCRAIVDKQKSELAKQIIAATHRKMRDASDLERVFFVGGTVLLLRDQLEELYQHAEFVDDPQFANARGMLKAAMFLQPR
ncbi:TPA: ParM/StbA family protein [Burkholderia cenocepacia]|uniref:ParM/StbA family protein n=1 Tax=Burkholderia cenocepacia TaxID=95486 RepID=UPI001B900905|nr:ParM/StbA family protein [Burkholderia cenocepacia]MBR8427243.1 ParM/StbA family protein [Burkholderia cenocepacia]HEP6430541.1 ParM/StbA family protein [Burkholderia cenocepacia]